MDIFDSFIRVHLCANTDDERQRGVDTFKRLLGAGNVTVKSGFWQEYDEPDVVVEWWFNSDTVDAPVKVDQVLRACEVWQKAAEQVGISLEVSTPTGRRAVVVYEGEWERFREYLSEYVDRLEYLTRYFEIRAEIAAAQRLVDTGHPLDAVDDPRQP